MRDVARFLPLRKALSSIWTAFYVLIGVSSLFYLINFYILGQNPSESAHKFDRLVRFLSSGHQKTANSTSSSVVELAKNLRDLEIPAKVASIEEHQRKQRGKRKSNFSSPKIETFYHTLVTKTTTTTTTTTTASTTTKNTKASTTTNKKTEKDTKKITTVTSPPPDVVRDLEHLQEKLKVAAQLVTPAAERKEESGGESPRPTSIFEPKPKKVPVEDSEHPTYISDGQCPPMDCPHGQFSIYLQSGYRLTTCPMVCWETANLIEHNYSQKCPESSRGLHVVVLSQAPAKVKSKKVFDTYTRDEDLMDFLLGPDVVTGDVILAATFDESSTMLQENTRTVLGYFGSQYIQSIRFRDTFVMVGQKGIEKGAAYEAMRHKRVDEEFAQPVTLSMCAKFPLATVANLPPAENLRQLGSNVRIGSMSHCNIDTNCPSPGTIPVFLTSGHGNKGDPQLCVNSHLVFHPIMKIGKRGYNMAEYDPISQQIVTRDAFDGYTEEPSRLVIFLDQIADGNLLLGVIHDDASVRQLAYYFEAFGIAIVHEVRYRSVAWFIGQRGAKHAYQQISQSPDGKDYAPQVTFRACIPTQIVGLRRPAEERMSVETSENTNGSSKEVVGASKPPPLLSQAQVQDAEDRRNNFCSRFIGYTDFCFQTDQLRQMTPDAGHPLVAQHWHAVEEADLDRVPVAVMAGSDFNLLHLTLETLSNQPGLRRDLVTVFAADIVVNDEVKALVVETFQFNLERVPVFSYEDLYRTALENASFIAEQKNVDAFIFIEPDVALSPDFFTYLSNLYSSVFNDEASSFAGISAWNPNGYEFFSNDANVTYLSDNAMPSPCFLMRRSYFNDFIKPSYEKCCHDAKSRFSPWKLSSSSSPFLMPDVSRCFKKPPALAVAKGVEAEGRLIESLFYHPRRTSLTLPTQPAPSSRSSRLKHLRVSNYGDHIHQLLNQSIYLQIELSSSQSPSSCDFVKTSPHLPRQTPIAPDRVRYFVLFQQKEGANDWTELHQIARCFGLEALAATTSTSSSKDGAKPVGIYKQTFRFTTPTAEYILVSKISPFFTYKLLNQL